MHSLDGTEEQEISPVGGGPESEDSPMDDTGSSPSGFDKPYASEELQPSVLQKMTHDSNFTEDINMRMQIPSKLTVVSHRNDDGFKHHNGDILSRMEVPERIVVSMGENGVRFGGGQDTSASLYMQDFMPGGSSPEPVSLTTPPRKLTLAERNLDALDVPETQRNTQSKTDNKSSSSATGGPVHDTQQTDSSEEQDDISLMRRQIFKLHRRITAMEKLQAERSKRDVYIYAVTVAFWVLNGWFLYSFRKPY